MIIQIFNGSEKGVRGDSKIVRFDFEIVHCDPENTVNKCHFPDSAHKYWRRRSWIDGQ
jgi:hypothetical protein